MVGVYKCKLGKDTAVLTLKTGNQATFSLAENLAGIPIPYKVENGSVVLMGGANKEVRFVIEKQGSVTKPAISIKNDQATHSNNTLPHPLVMNLSTSTAFHYIHLH